jgi:hypothetical protein
LRWRKMADGKGVSILATKKLFRGFSEIVTGLLNI